MRAPDPAKKAVFAAICASFFVLAGCASPVAGNVDDAQADRIVVALGRAGIDAQKAADGANDGKFDVTVAQGDATRALAVLADEGLPEPAARAGIDALGKDELVPSVDAERARLAGALSAELEKSLESVDGVLRARVHLNLPDADPLRDGLPPKSSASVLLTTRPGPSPIAIEAVQRLVAAGSPSLAAQDVAVVIVPRTAASHPMADFAHVGPIAVAPGSARTLVTLLAVLLALLAATTTAMLVFYMRSIRQRRTRRA
ncbi:MAG: secretion protein [Polyangiaceae bacterium]